MPVTGGLRALAGAAAAGRQGRQAGRVCAAPRQDRLRGRAPLGGIGYGLACRASCRPAAYRARLLCTHGQGFAWSGIFASSQFLAVKSACVRASLGQGPASGSGISKQGRAHVAYYAQCSVRHGTHGLHMILSHCYCIALLINRSKFVLRCNLCPCASNVDMQFLEICFECSRRPQSVRSVNVFQLAPRPVLHGWDHLLAVCTNSDGPAPHPRLGERWA